ncbi:hypothetical protein SUDANB121_05969 (plasmid) [Nocardiopsis dassonvillei]|uniref:hypothetical protein n=1 Tax=Nocardiopsis dassonvillei TaxID=2014 RepID=UPI003F545313
MYPTMMPPVAAPETSAPSLTLSAPAWLEEVTPDALDALGITDADDLFAVALEEETEEERAARLAAAADILDDRLAEIAAETLTADVVRGWAL